MWLQFFTLGSALKPKAFGELSRAISKVLSILLLGWDLMWPFISKSLTQTKEEWGPPPPLLLSLRHCGQWQGFPFTKTNPSYPQPNTLSKRTNVCSLLRAHFPPGIHGEFLRRVGEEGENHIRRKPNIILLSSVLSKGRWKPKEEAGGGKSAPRSCSENHPAFHAAAGRLHPGITIAPSPHRKLTGKCFLFVFLKQTHLQLTWGGFLQANLFPKQYFD